MDFASIIVIVIRLIIPFSILRFPLLGIIACILLDTFDINLLNLLGGEVFLGGISYHILDKMFDLYYFSFAFFIALKWKNRLVRNAIKSLFFIRLIGTLLLLFTGYREFLIIFPNIFEVFFIYCLVANRWFPKVYPNTLSKLLIVLVILGLPKIAWEYLLHYEGISMWGWIRDSIKWILSLFF